MLTFSGYPQKQPSVGQGQRAFGQNGVRAQFQLFKIHNQSNPILSIFFEKSNMN